MAPGELCRWYRVVAVTSPAGKRRQERHCHRKAKRASLQPIGHSSPCNHHGESPTTPMATKATSWVETRSKTPCLAMARSFEGRAPSKWRWVTPCLAMWYYLIIIVDFNIDIVEKFSYYLIILVCSFII
jgi:hypothetical protein